MRANLKREFVITPGYDRRPEYGQHCAEMRFYVKGEKGVVQFILFTGWYPCIIPKPDAPWQELCMPIKLDPLDHPMPADLGYHSLAPIHNWQTSPTYTDCSLLDQRACYYDGSGLNCYRIFSVMVHEGGERMWEELEKFYAEVFETPVETMQAAKAAEAKADGVQG